MKHAINFSSTSEILEGGSFQAQHFGSCAATTSSGGTRLRDRHLIAQAGPVGTRFTAIFLTAGKTFVESRPDDRVSSGPATRALLGLTSRNTANSHSGTVSARISNDRVGWGAYGHAPRYDDEEALWTAQPDSRNHNRKRPQGPSRNDTANFFAELAKRAAEIQVPAAQPPRRLAAYLEMFGDTRKQPRDISGTLERAAEACAQGRLNRLNAQQHGLLVRTRARHSDDKQNSARHLLNASFAFRRLWASTEVGSEQRTMLRTLGPLVSGPGAGVLDISASEFEGITPDFAQFQRLVEYHYCEKFHSEVERYGLPLFSHATFLKAEDQLMYVIDNVRDCSDHDAAAFEENVKRSRHWMWVFAEGSRRVSSLRRLGVAEDVAMRIASDLIKLHVELVNHDLPIAVTMHEGYNSSHDWPYTLSARDSKGDKSRRAPNVAGRTASAAAAAAEDASDFAITPAHARNIPRSVAASALQAVPMAAPLSSQTPPMPQPCTPQFYDHVVTQFNNLQLQWASSQMLAAKEQLAEQTFASARDVVKAGIAILSPWLCHLYGVLPEVLPTGVTRRQHIAKLYGNAGKKSDHQSWAHFMLAAMAPSARHRTSYNDLLNLGSISMSQEDMEMEGTYFATISDQYESFLRMHGCSYELAGQGSWWQCGAYHTATVSIGALHIRLDDCRPAEWRSVNDNGEVDYKGPVFEADVTIVERTPVWGGLFSESKTYSMRVNIGAYLAVVRFASGSDFAETKKNVMSNLGRCRTANFLPGAEEVGHVAHFAAFRNIVLGAPNVHRAVSYCTVTLLIVIVLAFCLVMWLGAQWLASPVEDLWRNARSDFSGLVFSRRAGPTQHAQPPTSPTRTAISTASPSVQVVRYRSLPMGRSGQLVPTASSQSPVRAATQPQASSSHAGVLDHFPVEFETSAAIACVCLVVLYLVLRAAGLLQTRRRGPRETAGRPSTANVCYS